MRSAGRSPPTERAPAATPSTHTVPASPSRGSSFPVQAVTPPAGGTRAWRPRSLRKGGIGGEGGEASGVPRGGGCKLARGTRSAGSGTHAPRRHPQRAPNAAAGRRSVAGGLGAERTPVAAGRGGGAVAGATARVAGTPGLTGRTSRCATGAAPPPTTVVAVAPSPGAAPPCQAARVSPPPPPPLRPPRETRRPGGGLRSAVWARLFAAGGGVGLVWAGEGQRAPGCPPVVGEAATRLTRAASRRRAAGSRPSRPAARRGGVL